MLTQTFLSREIIKTLLKDTANSKNCFFFRFLAIYSECKSNIRKKIKIGGVMTLLILNFEKDSSLSRLARINFYFFKYWSLVSFALSAIAKMPFYFSQ